MLYEVITRLSAANEPAPETNDSPAGSVSRTAMVPLEGALPVFVTTIV